MAKSMTPSVERKTMTDGQIEKAVDAYRALLRKQRDELGSEEVQQALGSDGYVAEMLGVLRRRVEAVSDMIVRRVTVNRSRTPEEALKATGRNRYTDDNVVAGMPRGEGDEAAVCFFKVGRYVSDDDLEKEYALRDLVPADAYSLAAVNEDDPSFGDDHPNSTHWKDSKSKWCCAAFDCWDGGRSVRVRRNDGDWDGRWWFAGLRKS